jgi:hypothetical protein
LATAALDEQKARITAAIANVTEGIILHIWQEVDYRWTVKYNYRWSSF